MTETGSRDQAFARAEGNSLFPTVPFTRAIGQTTSSMARADTSLLMEISMKVNGKKTNFTV